MYTCTILLEFALSWPCAPSLVLDIAFFGPYGSGKTSLIGSLYRAVNAVGEFPERVQKTLNVDGHGTTHWLETYGNSKNTIVYQDTRGHEVKNNPLL